MIVLFIDDEERRMRPVVEEFDEAGHKIHFIKSVDEALAIIRATLNQKFDLIVMDISMPSGEELRPPGNRRRRPSPASCSTTFSGKARPTQKVAVLTQTSGSSVESKFSSEDPYAAAVRAQTRRSALRIR